MIILTSIFNSLKKYKKGKYCIKFNFIFVKEICYGSMSYKKAQLLKKNIILCIFKQKII